LHHRKESSKLLAEVVRENPQEIVLLTLGPLQNVVAASERAPDFLNQLSACVCLGGSLSAGGDVTASAEANILMGPEAARAVLHAAAPKLLIPLDVSNKVLLTMDEAQRLTTGDSRVAKFLQHLFNYSLRAHHAHLGMESLLLREVVALAAVTQPQLFKTESVYLDVELRGELTRGMTIYDRRLFEAPSPNATVATDVDAAGVIDYLMDVVLRNRDG
jgi:inosine-uridine nucleoside N-ribohydrolase